MKALKLVDRLKVVYSAIYAKKHHGTVKEVVKEYGISRPAFYVYKREIIALLNAIGFDEDSFFSYITEHGEKGYTEIMEKIVEFKEKKKQRISNNQKNRIYQNHYMMKRSNNSQNLKFNTNKNHH